MLTWAHETPPLCISSHTLATVRPGALFRQFLLLSQSNCLCFCVMLVILIASAIIVVVYSLQYYCCCCYYCFLYSNCHQPPAAPSPPQRTDIITLSALPSCRLVAFSSHTPWGIFLRTHLPVLPHFVTVVGRVMTFHFTRSSFFVLLSLWVWRHLRNFVCRLLKERKREHWKIVCVFYLKNIVQETLSVNKVRQVHLKSVKALMSSKVLNKK